MISLRRHLQPHPQPSGYHSPEEDEEAVAPVNGDDGAVVADASCDGEGNIVWVELERVVISISNEGCADKAWTDVVEVDMVDASYAAELAEAFHVVVGVAFGGGVGWGGSEPAGAGYAADDSEVPLSLRMLLEVVEGCANHLGETCHVGGDSGHLLFKVKSWILIADTCAVEVEVHAACLADEAEKTARGIFLCDVDALGGDDIEVLALNLLQQGLPPPCYAYLPALRGEHLDHFESNA